MAPCDGLFDIRRAREDDAEAIAAVHVAGWRTSYQKLMPADYLAQLSTETRATRWRDTISQLPEERRPWVAENHGQVVGFAHSGAARDDDATPRTGELYLVYIPQECRSRGLGVELMHRAQQDLIGSGNDEAVLWVLEANAAARQFYERLGWRSDGRTQTRDFGGRGLVEVRYRIALNSEGRSTRT